MARIAYLQQKVAEQRRWIDSNGGDRLGYVQHYGDSNGPVDQRTGDGGQVIYAADRARLTALLDELNGLTGPLYGTR